MRFLVKVLLAASVTVWCGSAAALPAEVPRVALIVSLEPDAVSIPAVELFRAVTDAASTASGWRAASLSAAKANLGAPTALKQLGVIPAFDRKSFVKARQAIKDHKAAMIPSVQAMLDTLALDGAVIVDCRPKADKGGTSTASVTGCGLYYYDRALARVLAATTKDFKVGINDATRWAPELLTGLSQGLHAYASNAERERVRATLAEHAEEREPQELTAEVKLSGTNLADPLHHVTSAPMAGLALGTRAKGFVAGLEVETGTAAAELPAGRCTLAARSAGLFVSAETRALEALLWDLGLGVSYVESAASLAGSGGGRIDNRAVALNLTPGLLWQVNKTVEWGAGATLSRYVPMTETAAGAYVGTEFAKNVVGLGIRLRAVL